ncbi:MAG: AsmA family protein [Cytophagales bacterium]|nr:AsmA family protein [Cytophagales bacterium]
MRKFLVFLAVFVTLLLITAIILPVVFKDDIQEGIHKSLNENIEAEVYFDPSKFGLTLFKNFPNPTASLGEFGVVGIDRFEADTLLSAKSLNLTIDLFSLFGNTYVIKSINLIEPNINLIILENGEANYEIVKESGEDTLETEPSAPVDFNLSIDQWNISDGTFRYSDKSMDFHMEFKGLNHSGSGNISLDNYDLTTLSNIEHATLEFEGTKYLSGQKLFANATLNIDMTDFRFTFKENVFRINDFPVSMDGYLAMPSEDIEMDIAFSSKNGSVKSLYSLIPGTYTSDFENINTEGRMSFNGFVKGIYNDSSLPAYRIALKISNGMISYPELPMPIKNIDMDLSLDCEDGNIDHTRIEIKQMHLEAGTNPIDATLLVKNLKNYDMEADINARLDLAELASVFPIKELEMKGLLSIQAKAEGMYDSTQNIMPAVTASIHLANGYFKSSEFPKALEKLSIASAIDCPSGKPEDFRLNVDDFSISMGKERISGDLSLTNLNNYTWDLNVKGNLDLEVISAIYPIEGISYEGLLSADLGSKGKYSDVEAGRYDRLPASGKVHLKDFSYSSNDLPVGISIEESSLAINPKRINVESFDGMVGKSDMSIEGYVENYLDYVFGEHELLSGEMELTSRILDVNEWMTGEATSPETSADTSALEIVAIPRNIDFKFQSSIDNIYYDNLNLQKAKGLLSIRDGVLDMSNLSFNLLGGSVLMNGKYDTRIPDSPVFNYQLNIKALSIPDAFASFSTVRTFAPMAQLMNGDFSTNFSISGLLKEDMSPVYESLNGAGLIQIAKASLKESKLVSGIAGFMKSDLKSDRLSLKDVIMKASLENGRVHVSPFDVDIGGQKANISGSLGADGTLDYFVRTEVEAGAIGQQVNQLLAGLQGEDVSSAGSKIKLNFNVGGTYDKPKILLAGTSGSGGAATTIQEQVKEEVKQEVQAALDSAQQEAEQKIQDEATKLVEKGEDQLQQQLDTLKKELTKNLEKETGKILEEELDSTTNELKKSLQNLFKKKKKGKN